MVVLLVVREMKMELLELQTLVVEAEPHMPQLRPRATEPQAKAAICIPFGVFCEKEAMNLLPHGAMVRPPQPPPSFATCTYVLLNRPTTLFLLSLFLFQ